MFYYNDYIKGRNKEIELLPLLRQKFSPTLELTDRFHIFDYKSKEANLYIELKCRNNKRDKYKDTMIGFNKIRAASMCHPHYDVYFVFQYTDGIYYWKYNKNELLQFEVKDGGRTDRGCNEINTYVYIPVNILKNI
jgi:hypothetical protein